MDLDQMYEMGFAAGEEELEKLASEESFDKEAILDKLRAKIAKRDQGIHLKRFKKRGGKLGFKDLSRGKKALGLGAIAAAAAGGSRLAKRKG